MRIYMKVIIIALLLLLLCSCMQKETVTTAEVSVSPYLWDYIAYSEYINYANSFLQCNGTLLTSGDDFIAIWDEDLESTNVIFTEDTAILKAVGVDRNGIIAAVRSLDGKYELIKLNNDGTIVSTDAIECPRDKIEYIHFTVDNRPVLAGIEFIYDIQNDNLIEDGNIGRSAQIETGIIIRTITGSLRLLNEDTFTLGSTFTWEGGPVEYETYGIASDYAGNLLVSAKDGLYAIDLETWRAKLILDWDPETLTAGTILTGLSGQRYIIQALGSAFVNYDYIIYSPNSNGKTSFPQAKTVLSLGGWAISDETLYAVGEFNKSNKEFEIVYECYFDTYGDRLKSDGDTKILLRIMSGDVPDIFELEATTYEDYAKAGLLLDIYSLMDNDPDFDESQYFENIFKASEADGKLYQFIPLFGFSGIAGKQELLAGYEGWTIADFADFTDTLEPGTTWIRSTTSAEVLKEYLAHSVEGFVDVNSSSCSFDTQQFIDVLEFANMFPHSFTSVRQTYWDLIDGSAALDIAVITSLDNYIIYRTLLGGQPMYIGYPSSIYSTPVGYAYQRYAISSTCKYSEAAWEFLKLMLRRDFQECYAKMGSAFPISISVFDGLIADAMKEPPERDEPSATILSDGIVVVESPLTEENARQIREIITGIESIYGCLSKVTEIVLEEADSFFSGNKTAEEAARIIQNRVNTWLAE